MRERDPEFLAWIERAKAGSMEEAMALCGFQPNSARGIERVGPCPACGGRSDGKPSNRFAVHLSKRKFNCRGCGLKGANALALALVGDRLPFLEACEALSHEKPPRPVAGESAEAKARREAERAARLEAARAEEARRAQAAAQDEAARVSRARRLWEAARDDLAPVRAYLAARGLETAGLNWAALRCIADLPLMNDAGAVLHRGPAMIAAIVDGEGKLAAVHRTWLGAAADGSSRNGRPDITDPETGDRIATKKGLGLKKGGVIPLTRRPGAGRVRLFLGEGIETTLSVYSALRRAGSALLADSVFWCGVDLGNIAHSVPVPRWAGELVLLGDGDSAPEHTRAALEACAARARAAGVKARLLMAPPGQDFNDVLRAA